MYWKKGRIISVLFLLVLLSITLSLTNSSANENCPEANSGFQRPIANSHSGWQFLDWNGSEWHPGWDYNGSGSGDADEGLEIVAVADGVVVSAPSKNPTSWGSLVIKHIYKKEIVYSQYGHMKTVSVSKGDIITKGQPVGTLGKVGTNSAHLHWEIRKSIR